MLYVITEDTPPLPVEKDTFYHWSVEAEFDTGEPPKREISTWMGSDPVYVNSGGYEFMQVLLATDSKEAPPEELVKQVLKLPKDALVIISPMKRKLQRYTFKGDGGVLHAFAYSEAQARLKIRQTWELVK